MAQKRNVAPNSDVPNSYENTELWITPTIYFKPLFVDNQDKCESSHRVAIKDKLGKVLTSVCSKDFNQCLMQGSCRIEQEGKIRRFNFYSVIQNEARFFEITSQECQEGYGVQNRCLEPFVSVAADVRYHPVGTIFYIEKLRGLVLPNGKIHDGFLVVEDRGGMIEGVDRLDFYTGQWSWRDRKNPFVRLGLGDPKSTIPILRLSKINKSSQFKKY